MDQAGPLLPVDKPGLVLCVRLIAAFILAGAVLWAMTARTTMRTTRVEWREVTVQAGDSLWTIAGRSASPQADLRRVVREIRAANDLGSAAILPGQVLLVPAAADGNGRRG